MQIKKNIELTQKEEMMIIIIIIKTLVDDKTYFFKALALSSAILS